MAARRSRKTTELCQVHFPRGWHDQPKGARVVSCEHGSWDAPPKQEAPPKQPAPPKDPETPKDPEDPKEPGDGDAEGQGDGEGAREGDGEDA